MEMLGFSPKSKDADTDGITLDVEEGGGGVGQSAFMTAFFDKVAQVHPGPSLRSGSFTCAWSRQSCGTGHRSREREKGEGLGLPVAMHPTALRGRAPAGCCCGR